MKARKLFIILGLLALVLAIWSIKSEDRPVKEAKLEGPVTLQEGPLPKLAWRYIKEAGYPCETIVRVQPIGNKILGDKIYKVKAVSQGEIRYFVINAQDRPPVAMTWQQFAEYRERPN